ncbi:MAG: glycosyltransferase family 2 protein [Caulobacterales bacterium]|nr:glycosyltransferase family 2 protein [Caulobacterales bacterium]
MVIDGAPVPEKSGEIRAVLCVRDELLRLPANLDHHRRLGVDRFLVVDNGSRDGTADYLASQPDVHMFRAAGTFEESLDGLAWTNPLRDAFCDGHWTLSLDADELFVFPYYEQVGLQTLCRFLDQAGARTVYALLLDMYGEGGLSQAVLPPGGSLIDTCAWFDPGPYRLTEVPNFPYVRFRGGVRARVFDFQPWQGAPPALNKLPLVKWARGMRYLLSTHEMTPTTLYPLMTCLLHFKFLSDFHARVVTAVDEQWHYGAARDFQAYRALLDARGDITLRNAQSVRYAGSQQLLDLQIMRTDAAWPAFLSAQMA